MFQVKINNNLLKTFKKLKRFSNNISKEISKIQEIATIEAINVASESTPPFGSRGVGTTTGSLKGAWARDSITKSYKKDKKFVTLLANNEVYASFVDKGHKLTRHFVPGLIINPISGLLEKAPAGMKGGIIVGTKTNYIPGAFMVDKAVDAYKHTSEKLLQEKLKEFESL